jgi:hypothetical protein
MVDIAAVFLGEGDFRFYLRFDYRRVSLSASSWLSANKIRSREVIS